jgi:hypothetical protein
MILRRCRRWRLLSAPVYSRARDTHDIAWLTGPRSQSNRTGGIAQAFENDSTPSLAPAHAASPVMRAVLLMMYRLFAYTHGDHRIVVIHWQEKTTRSDSFSMRERVIQKHLWAILGLECQGTI